MEEVIRKDMKCLRVAKRMALNRVEWKGILKLTLNLGEGTDSCLSFNNYNQISTMVHKGNR